MKQLLKTILFLIFTALMVVLPLGNFKIFAKELNQTNYVDNELLIKFKNDEEIYVLKLGQGSDISKIISGYKKDGQVEFIEPNYIYKMSAIPNDQFYNNQWYLPQVNLPQVWDTIKDIPEITIAILDSGVDYDHPDLVNNIWVNTKEILNNGKDDDYNGYIDDVHGWDFVTKSSDPSPQFDTNYSEAGMHHGTVVAGIAGASGNNGAGITGAAWKVKIMPLRVLNSLGEGNVKAVDDAVKYAIANGADVINMSFVGYDYSSILYNSLKQAYDKGIAIVAASGNTTDGNNGTDLDQIRMYPICYDVGKQDNIIIGVSATNETDRKADFANYGSDCVDLSAPGVKFFSTQFYDPSKTEFQSLYGGYWSGTSLAAPIVSGSIALIKSIKADLTISQLYDVIIENTDDISNLNPTYGNDLGSGRLNILKSLNSALKTDPSSGVIKLLPREQSSGEPGNTVGQDSEKYLNILNTDDEMSLSVLAGKITRSFPEVKLFDSTGLRSRSFFAFNRNIQIGANVAITDFENNGSVEIVIGAASGGGPQVRIFDRAGNVKGQFFAYDPNFRGGVEIGIGDVDGNGIKDIITAAGKGGGAHVRIFNAEGKLINHGFFAFPESYKGGIHISSGDLNNDGKDEIIIGSGVGVEPSVQVFDYNGNLLRKYIVYNTAFHGGVNVDCGDLDGDGKLEIVTGTGYGGGPHVRVFDYDGILKSQFFAYDKNFRGGVSVAVGDIDNDNTNEIVTGPGIGGGLHIRIFDIYGIVKGQYFAYDQTYTGGINVSVLK